MIDKKLEKILKKVEDPELGENVLDLGLIYEAKVVGEKKAYVKMTLTTPTCPLGYYIVGQVENVFKENGYDVEIEVTFDPPWDPSRMKPELRKKYGLEVEE